MCNLTVALSPLCQPEDHDVYDAITLGLHQTNLGLTKQSATSPTTVPDKAAGPHVPAKAQDSFLHTDKSLAPGPRILAKEDNTKVNRLQPPRESYQNGEKVIIPVSFKVLCLAVPPAAG